MLINEKKLSMMNPNASCWRWMVQFLFEGKDVHRRLRRRKNGKPWPLKNKHNTHARNDEKILARSR
jgi:hypothetical protein